jgi:hypothetical protein
LELKDAWAGVVVNQMRTKCGATLFMLSSLGGEIVGAGTTYFLNPMQMSLSSDISEIDGAKVAKGTIQFGNFGFNLKSMLDPVPLALTTLTTGDTLSYGIGYALNPEELGKKTVMVGKDSSEEMPGVKGIYTESPATTLTFSYVQVNTKNLVGVGRSTRDCTKPGGFYLLDLLKAPNKVILPDPNIDESSIPEHLQIAYADGGYQCFGETLVSMQIKGSNMVAVSDTQLDNTGAVQLLSAADLSKRTQKITLDMGRIIRGGIEGGHFGAHLVVVSTANVDFLAISAPLVSTKPAPNQDDIGAIYVEDPRAGSTASMPTVISADVKRDSTLILYGTIKNGWLGVGGISSFRRYGKTFMTVVGRYQHALVDLEIMTSIPRTIILNGVYKHILQIRNCDDDSSLRGSSNLLRIVGDYVAFTYTAKLYMAPINATKQGMVIDCQEAGSLNQPGIIEFSITNNDPKVPTRFFPSSDTLHIAPETDTPFWAMIDPDKTTSEGVYVRGRIKLLSAVINPVCGAREYLKDGKCLSCYGGAGRSSINVFGFAAAAVVRFSLDKGVKITGTIVSFFPRAMDIYDVFNSGSFIWKPVIENEVANACGGAMATGLQWTACRLAQIVQSASPYVDSTAAYNTPPSVYWDYAKEALDSAYVYPISVKPNGAVTAIDATKILSTTTSVDLYEADQASYNAFNSNPAKDLPRVLSCGGAGVQVEGSTITYAGVMCCEDYHQSVMGEGDHCRCMTVVDL